MEDSDSLAATLAAKQKELDELDAQIKSSNASKEPRFPPPPHSSSPSCHLLLLPGLMSSTLDRRPTSSRQRSAWATGDRGDRDARDRRAGSDRGRDVER